MGMGRMSCAVRAPPLKDSMPSMYMFPCLLLLGAPVCLLGALLKKSSFEKAARRLEVERAEAYRLLYGPAATDPLHARFSYRPATGELFLDANAARMHGMVLPGPGLTGEIRLDGWHLLPAAKRAAGWIDEALADGLKRREVVRCEYLARMAGRPDRSVKLAAMPLQGGGLLVGYLEERLKA